MKVSKNRIVKFMLVISLLGMSGLWADTGVIDRRSEMDAIRQQTNINGRQTYPHGFYTNETIQTQLNIDNSAVKDNVGGTGVRYQITNPNRRYQKISTANQRRVSKKRGFSFAQMAKDLKETPKKSRKKRGLSFSSMAEGLRSGS